MPVLVLGLSHRTAPVGLLERLALGDADLPKALAVLAERPHLREVAALSTCNRVEVWAVTSRFHGGLADLRTGLAQATGVPVDELAPFAYDRYADAAVEHVLRVAAGLDSLVTGEPQILAQVRDCLAVAEEAGTAGRTLAALLRRSVRVGRRVRAETGVADGGRSMVDAGLEAVRAEAGPLDGAEALVVGAGAIGALAVDALQQAGAARVRVANRDRGRARELASRSRGEVDAVALGDVGAVLADADVVVCSTAAREPVVAADDVERAMTARPDRPLALVDLALPRDVDPAAADVPGVVLLDVDRIARSAETGGDAREVARAEGIVRAEAARFVAWQRQVRVDPVIAALRRRAEEVRADELDRLAPRLGDLDQRQREALEALTRGLVNTLLHDPTVRLKEAAERDEADAHVEALRELFDLDER